jgi:WD40 repeat protein
VRIEKSSATLTGRFVAQWPTGFEAWGGSQSLRRTGQGWKIVEERAWPLNRREGDRVTVYDAAYWELADALVVLVRYFGDSTQLARVLDVANRPTEAHATARRLTERKGATAADWVLRGDLAVKAGDAADALRSHRTALTLDPNIRVPAPLNGEVLTLRGHAGRVYGVSLSPDATRAVSSGDDDVRLWDLRSGKQLRVLPAHSDGISAVAFSPDGKRIATGGGDKLVKIWDAATGKLLHTLTGHTDKLSRVAFSKGSRRLVSCGNDSTARVWDVDTGKPIVTLQGHEGGVLSAVFSPDGKRIATGSYDRTIKLWDAQTGKGQRTLVGHSGQVIRVAFHPEGKRLASASADGTVRLWDVEQGTLLRTIPSGQGVVETVAFSPNGTRLASGGADSTVRLWDAATGKQLRTLHGHARGQVYAVEFNREGNRLISAGGDGTVRLWEVGSTGR